MKKYFYNLNPKTKGYLSIFFFIFFISITALAFYFIGTENIINYVGVNNSYYLLFAFAFIAGFSAFNSAPYYYLLFLFATSGLSPIILAITGSLGVMIGDSIVYYVGRNSENVLPDFLKSWQEKFTAYIKKHPKLFPIFCFFYGCFSPFSNTFISIAAGISEISYARFIVPLTLGNTVYMFALVYVAIYASDSLRSLFF